MLLTDIQWTAYLPHIAVALLTYRIYVYIYRLYFSPLSRFPGPKLAAMTSLHEAYYDLVLDGQYPWRIREMHKIYGPVVRVNPREVHVQDPDYVDELYLQRLDKDPWFSRSFNIPLASFGTWSQDVHRQRRGAINRFFSKASIVSRMEIIQGKVLKFCNCLASAADSKEVVQLDAGFICMTVDIITQFFFGASYNYLDKPGFDKTFKAAVEAAFGAGAFNRHVPGVMILMLSLPMWTQRLMAPKLASIFRLNHTIKEECKRVIAAVRHQDDAQSKKPEAESYYDTEHAGVSRKATVFNQIMDSNLPESEKTLERLFQESQSLVGAGSETTGRALSLGTFHMLTQPTVVARLRRELLTVMPTRDSTPTLTQLEHLPFLTAVVKESVRLGGSAATRMARLSPADNPLTYKEWVFPAGTPVSVTLHDVLSDPAIFPAPDEFQPMRWLNRTTDASGHEVLTPNTALDKYFVPFSRGPRSCVGMWLAWSELYMAIAHVFRKLDLELYDTTVEDVASYCDRFTWFAKPGNNGVRVKVVRLRE